jgi:hypothetical protein
VKDPLAIFKCAWICRLLMAQVMVPTSADIKLASRLSTVIAGLFLTIIAEIW